MVKKVFWRTNEQIPSGNLRVIGENKQLGVMSKDDALKLAREKGLDLVEVAPKASPPVARIIEFGKFKYQEEKKLKKAKKGSKRGELKEIRFSPFIGGADFDTRMKKVKKFLGEGDKVRLVVKFKGRQMGSKKFGYKVLENVVDGVESNISVDMEPKFIGRHLAMVISPMNKNIKKTDNQSKKKEEKSKSDDKNKTKDKKVS